MTDNPDGVWQRGVIPHSGNLRPSGRWLVTDNEANYLSKGNHAYSIDDVYYDLNSLGYRSKEFSAIDHRTFKILMVGCSQTMGIGLPNQEIYGYQLAGMLMNRYDIAVETINLGMFSCSIDYITRVLYQSVPILKPHYVFCLFPDLARREYIVRKDGLIQIEMFHPTSQVFVARDALLMLSTTEWDLFSFVKNLSFIDLILRDTRWAWDSWRVVRVAELMPYCDLGHYRGHTMLLSEHDKARDNLHSGKRYHRYIAEDLLADPQLQQAIAQFNSAPTI